MAEDVIIDKVEKDSNGGAVAACALKPEEMVIGKPIDFKADQKKKRDADKTYQCKGCGKFNVKKKSGNAQYVSKYCIVCLKKRSEERESKVKTRKELKNQDLISMSGPDLYPVYFSSEEERKFYLARWKSFKVDYDWAKSSDNGLLARMLVLEIEMYRLQKQIHLYNKPVDIKSLARMNEEYRRCQQDLGITRAKRIKEKEDESMAVVMSEMIKRFNEYQNTHPESFIYQCDKCGYQNKINIDKNEIHKEPETIEQIVMPIEVKPKQEDQIPQDTNVK